MSYLLVEKLERATVKDIRDYSNADWRCENE